MVKTSTTRVGWFEDPALNLRLPLLYNARTAEFCLVFAGNTYRNTKQQALEEEVRAALRTGMHLEWQPIIEVRPAHAFGMGNAKLFGFSLERKYVAQVPHGLGFRQVHWTANDRLATSTQLHWEAERDGALVPPCTQHTSGVPRLFLPYTDALWERLSLLQQQLEQLHRRFFEVMVTPTGSADLAAGKPLNFVLALEEVFS